MSFIFGFYCILLTSFVNNLSGEARFITPPPPCVNLWLLCFAFGFAKRHEPNSSQTLAYFFKSNFLNVNLHWLFQRQPRTKKVYNVHCNTHLTCQTVIRGILFWDFFHFGIVFGILILSVQKNVRQEKFVSSQQKSLRTKAFINYVEPNNVHFKTNIQEKHFNLNLNLTLTYLNAQFSICTNKCSLQHGWACMLKFVMSWINLVN